MLTKSIWKAAILAIAGAAGMAWAQTAAAAPSKFYRLEFVFKELESGKVLNSRSYMVIVRETDQGTIRAGGRVAVPSGGSSSGSTNALVNTQYTYMDLGVNIDIKAVTELPGGQMSLWVTANISSIPTETAGASSSLAPTIRQTQWSSSVVVPLKKPTLLFSSDDLSSKRQVQLELTASPIQ